MKKFYWGCKKSNKKYLASIVAVFFLGVFLLSGSAELNAQTHGDTRLVGGSSSESGIVEIFVDEDGDSSGEWSRMCVGSYTPWKDNGKQVAEVACRLAGFKGPVRSGYIDATPDSNAITSFGEDTTWAQEIIDCEGSEPSLFNCVKKNTSPSCQGHPLNARAVTAYCTAEDDTSNNYAGGSVTIDTSGDFRKVGDTLTANHSAVTDADGKPSEEGSYSYQWIRYWGNLKTAFTEITGATNSTYVLEREDETHLIKVRVSFTDDLGNAEEVTSAAVGPVYAVASDGDLRLADRVPAKLEGRLEIYDDGNGDGKGKWKGICDDDWDTEDAEVACTDMGFEGGTALAGRVVGIVGEPQRDQFCLNGVCEDLGPVINYDTWYRVPYLLDDVDCDGDESDLLDCDHAGRGVHNCSSYEHAGVSCEGVN